MDIEIFKVTSLAELKRIYHQIEDEEEVIKQDIDKLYMRHTDLSEEMVQLETNMPNLDLLQCNSDNLSKMILFAAELADGVSVKVRQLDLAKNRVHLCIKRVEDILDLKTCSEGAQKALSNEDYENAAIHIKRFLDMDENMLKMTTEEEAENSLKILHQTNATLKEIVINNFDKGVKNDDYVTIERFFKIFPLLGQYKIGLSKFGSYIASKIKQEMTSQLKLSEVSDPDRHSIKFVDLMTTLLETIAQYLKDYQTQIAIYYGHGYLLTLLTAVQQECDSWSTTILNKFRYERRFTQQINSVRSTISFSQSHVGNTEKLDPMELESLISEIVLINTRVELYLRFLRRRIENDFSLSQMKMEPSVSAELCSKFFSQSKLVNEMQELINNYILFEEYFLKEMVAKAININEVEEKMNVSKMVDSVFFVINKCLRRTLSSGNIEGVCAMLNLVSMVLTEQYTTETLQNRMKQSAFSSNAWMRDAYSYMQVGSIGLTNVASSTQLSNATNPSLNTGYSRQQTFILNLNNAERSNDCMQTLKVSLEKEIESLFQNSDKHSITKLRECLTAMSSSVHDKLREIVECALNELTVALIKPQVKTFLQSLSTMKFILTEDDFLYMEANDPWLDMFILNIQGMLVEYQETLVPGLYEKLIQKLCEEINYRIEKIIKNKSFNKLGGIQLDRGIRTLINFLASTTKWGVREKFSRVRQIATILNLEAVNEISSYWDGMTWRLTPNEVRQIMALRSDFRTDDIRKLKLT